MLNAREPKIVNGPQILDKYVGESEANIRKLFAEAEEEEKRVIMSLLLARLESAYSLIVLGEPRSTMIVTQQSVFFFKKWNHSPSQPLEFFHKCE